MSDKTLNEQQPVAAVEEPIDYKDKYLRLLADVENTRKRIQKEKQEMMRFALDSALTEILGPMDNLENALKFADKMSGEVRNWAQGFQMILAQFKDVLSQNGVTPFISEGQRFDAAKHEAVEMEETDQTPEGTILQEFVKGYSRGDRVIRPARVKVAKRLTIKEGESHDNTEEEK
jgi:molecular chaperone GrpE